MPNPRMSVNAKDQVLGAAVSPAPPQCLPCLPHPWFRRGGLSAALNLSQDGEKLGAGRVSKDTRLWSKYARKPVPFTWLHTKSEETCPHIFPVWKGRPGHLTDSRTDRLSSMNPKASMMWPQFGLKPSSQVLCQACPPCL